MADISSQLEDNKAVEGGVGIAMLINTGSKSCVINHGIPAFSASNILFDKDGNEKIADFGLATSGMRIGDAGNLSFGTPELGTSYYVAPELRTDMKLANYDEMVDVYSFGIMFFGMLHPPMETGSERDAVLGKVRKDPPVLPPLQIKLGTKALLERMLSHNSRSRPSSFDLPVLIESSNEEIED